MLLKLLVCNNERFGQQIQKHVKELVGHELNPYIYPILFDQIKVFVDKFFDSSGQVIYDVVFVRVRVRVMVLTLVRCSYGYACTIHGLEEARILSISDRILK